MKPQAGFTMKKSARSPRSDRAERFSAAAQPINDATLERNVTLAAIAEARARSELAKAKLALVQATTQLAKCIEELESGQLSIALTTTEEQHS